MAKKPKSEDYELDGLDLTRLTSEQSIHTKTTRRVIKGLIYY